MFARLTLNNFARLALTFPRQKLRKRRQKAKDLKVELSIAPRGEEVYRVVAGLILLCIIISPSHENRKAQAGRHILINMEFEAFRRERWLCAGAIFGRGLEIGANVKC
jgi:hypothetical protein